MNTSKTINNPIITNSVHTKTIKAQCIKRYTKNGWHIKKGKIFELSEDDIKSWTTRGYITRPNLSMIQ